MASHQSQSPKWSFAKLWGPAASLFAVLVLPTVASACQPSNACALERARQLAIAHLVPEPGTVNGNWWDAAHLVAVLERQPRSSDAAPVIATLLAEARSHGKLDLVLSAVASELADSKPERALQLATSIKDIEERDGALKDLLRHYTPGRPINYGERVVASMSPGWTREDEMLRLARAQLRAGLLEPARAVLRKLLTTAFQAELGAEVAANMRTSAQDLLACAAAREGDDALALEIAAEIEVNSRSWTLQCISNAQFQRGARIAGLQTLELRLELARDTRESAVAWHLIVDFAAAGDVDRALALGPQLKLEESRSIEAVATGQIRAGDFAGARANLERLSPSEIYQSSVPSDLAQALLLTDADIDTVLDTLESTDESADNVQYLIKEAAVELVARGQRQRAREVLDQGVRRALRRVCTGADCYHHYADDEIWEGTCAQYQHKRDTDLCKLSIVQVELGFLVEAEATTAKIGNDDDLVQVWNAIAQAQAAAGQLSRARSAFDRSLQIGLKSRDTLLLSDTIKAYADSIRSYPQLRDALPELQRTALQFLQGVDYITSTLNALAGAQANAGNFSAAFAIADTLALKDRASAYIEIFESSK
jgi:hypothetical protein